MRYLLLLSLLLAACGQTGDLYLPEKKTEPVQPPTPVAEDKKEKKK